MIKSRVVRKSTDQDLRALQDRADEPLDGRVVLGRVRTDQAERGGVQATRDRKEDEANQKRDRLLKDLLDAASIEAGNLHVFREPVALAELVVETVALFLPIAESHGLTLQAEVPAYPGAASLDRDRLLQVLANLVSNAIKFTPEGGRVRVKVAVSDLEVRFAVQDSGIGIPSDELVRIFDRYRKLSPTRPGLGLGLHISKFLIEAHGGRLWAESVVGEGSTFHAVLPRGVP